MKLLKRRWKEEKGFTLVELLAVIVILGIVAAIAVPSIGNIIEDSREDAHIANAQSFAEAARLYDVAESLEDELTEVTVAQLQSSGYIAESITSPTVPYDLNESVVEFFETNGVTTIEVTLIDEDGNEILSGDPNKISTDDLN